MKYCCFADMLDSIDESNKTKHRVIVKPAEVGSEEHGSPVEEEEMFGSQPSISTTATGTQTVASTFSAPSTRGLGTGVMKDMIRGIHSQKR